MVSIHSFSPSPPPGRNCVRAEERGSVVIWTDPPRLHKGETPQYKPGASLNTHVNVLILITPGKKTDALLKFQYPEILQAVGIRWFTPISTVNQVIPVSAEEIDRQLVRQFFQANSFDEVIHCGCGVLKKATKAYVDALMLEWHEIPIQSIWTRNRSLLR